MLQNVDQDGLVGCLQDKGSICFSLGAFVKASLMSLNSGKSGVVNVDFERHAGYSIQQAALIVQAGGTRDVTDSKFC